MARISFQDASGQRRMTPAHLRAMRMDMGMNMLAMARLLSGYTGTRISRDRYRTWERPQGKDGRPYVAGNIAEAAENAYNGFYDFVDTLVAMWDGEDPLVLVHRNDMFDEAELSLPDYITVDNYNQAVGKAWGRILEQGYQAELAFFTTDPQDLEGPASVHRRQGGVHESAP